MSTRKLQTAIGYHFRQEKLLEQALTHTSFANEQQWGRLASNERLEFLGDAVLELVSSEYFFHRYPELPEGELTKMRASFVCEPALYAVAETLQLNSYLRLGNGEDASGGRQRPSIVSDAFEAVIGAIYLDGGLERAREFIHRTVLCDTEHERFFFDSKTVLQEEIQHRGLADPEYLLLRTEGPDHQRVFTVQVSVNGEILGGGTGSSKKNAEQMAAAEALKKLSRGSGCI